MMHGNTRCCTCQTPLALGLELKHSLGSRDNAGVLIPELGKKFSTYSKYTRKWSLRRAKATCELGSNLVKFQLLQEAEEYKTSEKLKHFIRD